MAISIRRKNTWLVLGSALLIGVLSALVDGSTALATSKNLSNPAGRDAFGVTVIRPVESEQETEFLRSARLRADLHRAIVIR